MQGERGKENSEKNSKAGKDVAMKDTGEMEENLEDRSREMEEQRGKEAGKEETRHGEVKIVLWNVAGIHKVREAWSLLTKHEVIVLQETWVCERKEENVLSMLDDRYVWKAKAAIKCKKRGRPKGGQIVGVKREISEEWSVNEWEFGLIIKCEAKEHGEVIITVYNNVGIKNVINKLKNIIDDNVKEYKRVFIIGDLNARIGLEMGMNEKEGGKIQDNIRKSQDKVVNAEGKLLLRFCEEAGLKVLKWNGRAEGDLQGKITFTGGKDECCGSVLDLILVVDEGNRDNREVKYLEVIARSESDHLPVTFALESEEWCDRNVKCRKKGEGEEREREGGGKIEKLCYKGEAGDRYAEEIGRYIEEKGGVGSWEEFKEMIWEAARHAGMVKKVAKKRTGIGKPKWWNDECWEGRNRIWKALKKFLKNRNIENKRNLNEMRADYRRVCNELKRQLIQCKWKEVNKARDMAQWWKAINRFRAGRKYVNSKKISKQEWVTYFESLLTIERIDESQIDENTIRLQISQEIDVDENMISSISSVEMERTIRRIKSGKAPGEDGIKVEFIKAMSREAKEEMKRIINGIWDNGSLPEGWDNARIVPLHKAGSIDEAKNYRGISLLDAGYKILTAIVAERLSGWVERNKIIRESQAGFRKKRGTRDHIFVLNAIINSKIRHKGGKLYVAFVDFKAAFDKVNREKLLEKLRGIGIGGKMYNIIKEIYKRTKAEVQMGNETTEKFETNSGVRQRCALSAILFDLFIDDIDNWWEKYKEGGTVLGKEKIYAIKYADDVGMLADSPEGLRGMLKILEKWADYNEMYVSEEKTKIMVFRKGGRLTEKEEWRYKGKKLEVVNEFKYLGYWFTTKNSATSHIKKIKGKVQVATNAAWGIMRRAGRTQLKDRLYLMNSLVKSGILCAVETWGWGEVGNMKSVQDRYIKMALEVQRNTPGYIVRNEANTIHLEYTIRERAMRYVKDILRMGDERWPKICLLEEVRCIRNGNPSKWGQDMKQLLASVDKQDVIRKIQEGIDRKEIEEELDEGLKKLRENLIENDKKRIRRSEYNNRYRFLNTRERYNYWEDIELRREEKEIRARLRCGNIDRGKWKWVVDMKCRICGEEEESIEHLLRCNKAWAYMDEEVVEQMKEWLAGIDDLALQGEVINMLESKPIKFVCKYMLDIEELMRGRESTGEEVIEERDK